jgi:hypothetical protein
LEGKGEGGWWVGERDKEKDKIYKGKKRYKEIK